MAEKKRIFVADDDEAVLGSLKQLLHLSGFDVFGVSDATVVVGKIKEYAPDLILLDLLMPNLGGFEIVDLLQEDSGTKDIPVIIVSAIANFKDIKAVCDKRRSQKVMACVSKPFDFSKLLKQIKEILGVSD